MKSKWDKVRVGFGMTLLIVLISTILYLIIHVDSSESKAWVNDILKNKAYKKYKTENRKQICKQILQGNELVFECTYQYPSKAEFDKAVDQKRQEINTSKDTQ